MDSRREARNRRLIRNSMQRTINRNSELIKNKEILKQKTRQMLEDFKLNVTEEQHMIEIEETLKEIEEKIEKVYEDFIKKETERSVRAQSTNPELIAASDRFSKIVNAVKNTMFRDKMKHSQFKQPRNEQIKKHKGTLDEYKVNSEELKQISNRFSNVVKDVKNSMSDEKMQSLHFRQDMNKIIEEYRAIPKENKIGDEKKKKTLKYREIHNGEMGPEQEIEWDR